MRRLSAAVISAALVSVSLSVLGGPASAAREHGSGRAPGDRLVAASPRAADAGSEARSSGRARLAGRSAVGGTQLPMGGFGDIVADPAHGRVYVSGGPGQNGVTVVGSDGTVQRTVTGLPGATGMALSADGSQLYVALATGDGIEQISTSTLGTSTPTMTKLATGAGTCPTSVAVTAGLVWFGYGCDQWTGAIGAVDPSTQSVHLGLSSSPYYDPPMLGASPALSGVLFAGVTGQSPSYLDRYTVTAGTTPTATRTHEIEVGGNFGDLAFSPDGTQVVVADGAVYHHQIFSTTDLSAAGTYPTATYPNSIAVGSSGLVAAGSNDSAGPDVWIFAKGSTTPLRQFDFGDGAYLAADGLAVMGSSVYAVTWNYSAPYSIRVLSTLPPTKALSISASKSRVRYRGRVTITVSLPKPGSNHHVAVYRTPYRGTPRLLKSGSFSAGVFSVTTRVDRRTKFTADWGGNTSYGPTQRSVTVKAHGKVLISLSGYYARSHGYALYHASQDPKQYAMVLPLPAPCLTFRAQRPVSGGHWKTFSTATCVPTDVQGVAGAVLLGTHVPGERVRFQAVFAGDPANLAARSPWAKVRFTR